MEANTRNAETPVFSGVWGLLRMQANDEEVDREGNEVSLFTGLSSNPKKSGTQNGTQKKADRNSAPI